MDDKTKELIALGASVAAHCQPCFDWHLERAKGLGVAEDEIRAAIQVGFMVEEGAGKAMRKYTLEARSEAIQSGNQCCSGGSLEAGGCCC